MSIKYLCLALLWSVAASAIAAPNLLQNGSFEDYSKPPASWGSPGMYDNDVPIGSSLIPGWTVINDNIDYFGSFWQAAQGTRSLDLAGSTLAISSGGVSQTFATQAGASYLVTFALSGNPITALSVESPQPVKTLRVSAAGQSADFSYDVVTKGNSVHNMKYENEQFSFTANSSQTTLALFSTMADRASGPVIDNVFVSKVANVPEPSSALILFAGAVLLCLSAARSRLRARRQTARF
jgi:choice-of-anchor C domain-containing protein